MLEDTVFDSTDKGTLRPNAKPLRKKGDAFNLVKLPDFSWEIPLLKHMSPDDLITLFTMYYAPEIIDNNRENCRYDWLMVIYEALFS
jgi:hypothetical protein